MLAPDPKAATAQAATIHVVDDDVAVRDSIVFLLETAGYAVCAHATAPACLEAAPGTVIGCVITDVQMPEIDGLELQRRLAEAGCDLPVIVITGHSDVPMAVRALKAGAMDFLEKPFDDSKLLAAVDQAIGISRRFEIRCNRKTQYTVSHHEPSRIGTSRDAPGHRFVGRVGRYDRGVFTHRRRG